MAPNPRSDNTQRHRALRRDALDDAQGIQHTQQVRNQDLGVSGNVTHSAAA